MIYNKELILETIQEDIEEQFKLQEEAKVYWIEDTTTEKMITRLLWTKNYIEQLWEEEDSQEDIDSNRGIDEAKNNS